MRVARQGRRTTAAAAAAATLAALGFTACSSDGSPPGAASGTSSGPSTSKTTGATTSATTSATTGSPSSSTSGATVAGGPATSVAGMTVLATHLSVPWGLVRLDDGSYLVSLRDEARVVQVRPGGSPSAAVTAVPGTGPGGRVAGVHPDGEGGLLGLAMAPDDHTTLYAYLTAADDNRVVAMTFRGGRLGAPRAILTGIPKGPIHNGGRLAFGPDGMLYVTTGEGGDRPRAQDRSNLGGKILRVTRTGKPAPGNPFPGSPVWTYGHRNVQGIAWDAAGRMYASEFGQDTWDELNRIEPGRNYGWPVVEGMGTASDAAKGYTRPLAVWHTDDASPSGIAIGRGSVWMAALAGERLWRIPLRGNGSVGTPQGLLVHRYGRLRTAAFDPDGSLVVFTSNTFRGSPGPDDDRMLRLTLR